MKRKSKSNSDIVLYETDDGRETGNALSARDNFWLTPKTPAGARYLKKIFESGELVEDIVTHILKDFRGSEQLGVTAVTPRDFLNLIRART